MLPSALPRDPRAARAVRLAALLACCVVGAIGLGGLTLAPTAADRLRDDAFYEFAWAANLAAGRGPCVSDGATTSGVQLLWSLLLVPLAWAGGAAALPVLAPWLGVVLHVATAALWWRSGGDRWRGACVALLWLGQPLLVRECQNGQETALAGLFATLLWLQRRAGLPAFALLAGLAVFARTDLGFVVAALAVGRAWRGRRAVELAVPIVCAVASAAANAALGGGLAPDSALPMAWLWHANQRLADPSLPAQAAAAWWFARPVLLGGPFALAGALPIGLAVARCVRGWLPAVGRDVPLLAVAAAGLLGLADLATPLWVALFLWWWPRRASGVQVHPWSPLLLGVVAIVALHWAVRWYPRDYYLAPVVVLGAVALSRSRAPVLLLAAVSQLVDVGRLPAEPLAGQQELELAGRHLAAVLPAAERVGCFNSGLVTFHADVLAPPGQRRGVVNLDGVVDARPFAALQAAALDRWLDAEGIRFVVDNAVQFALDPRQPHACGRWFGPDFDPARDLVEVARFDLPGIDNGRPGGECVRLYWRRGRGAPPPPPAGPRELERLPDGSRVVLWPARAGQSLWQPGADGTRRTLLRADADTAAVVRVPVPPGGAVPLYVDERPAPVMVLGPL